MDTTLLLSLDPPYIYPGDDKLRDPRSGYHSDYCTQGGALHLKARCSRNTLSNKICSPGPIARNIRLPWGGCDALMKIFQLFSLTTPAYLLIQSKTVWCQTSEFSACKTHWATGERLPQNDKPPLQPGIKTYMVLIRKDQ